MNTIPILDVDAENSELENLETIISDISNKLSSSKENVSNIVDIVEAMNNKESNCGESESPMYPIEIGMVFANLNK
ncbi:hypothetical protein F8M41_018678 [Gigaspora margarita]|uniref:Uncharacterized protein n=1 Tax=Gigaspora margarita TaxID=4874 RepID=A0A8H4EU47_GIGMA|nr:hypothetical protein F8M41_018678 [Gigaspora margarita]